MKKVRKVNWTQGIHKLLIKYDLENLWNNPENLLNVDELKNRKDKSHKGHLKFWKDAVRKKVHNQEEKDWKFTLTTLPKLRTYIKVKEKLELEHYLLNNDNVKGTHFLTSLRVGTNTLRIETGRWNKESVEERKCKICLSGNIKDEEHFIMNCSAYQI